MIQTVLLSLRSEPTLVEDRTRYIGCHRDSERVSIAECKDRQAVPACLDDDISLVVVECEESASGTILAFAHSMVSGEWTAVACE